MIRCRLHELVRDTLAKRLFVLMWVTLVASQLVAYGVVVGWLSPHGPTPSLVEMGYPRMPPTPGFAEPRLRPAQPPGDRFGPPPEPDGGARPEARPPGGANGPHPLPTRLIVLDYAIRIGLIALASWWGARWLARPMARLVAASQQLGTAVDRQEAVVPLDELAGSIEVRQAARVFNEMASQLQSQFRARELMLAALSHDLRTPLTRLRLRLESEPESPERERSIADVRGMHALIDHTLDAFRGSARDERFHRTDVHALAQSVVDDACESGQAATLEGEPAIADVQPAALIRVLGNLVENAVRYGRRADVRVAVRGGEVLLVVEDEGPGIPPERLDDVLRPFVRLEASRHRDTGGVGLGLYIVQDIVRRQRGRFVLSNRAQGGLRAEVWLPRG